jgi:hypothetical protein
MRLWGSDLGLWASRTRDGFHPIKRFSNEKDAVALVNHLNGGAPLALSEAGLAEFEMDVDDD